MLYSSRSLEELGAAEEELVGPPADELLGAVDEEAGPLATTAEPSSKKLWAVEGLEDDPPLNELL